MNRSEILRLYRRIIRLSRDWVAQEPANTNKERQYIREEAQKGFRAHKSETDPEKIRDLLKEAEERVEIACHYQIPYDRLFYLPPSTSFGRFSHLKRKTITFYDQMLTHGQRQPSNGRFTGLQHRQNSKIVHPTLLSGTLPTDLLSKAGSIRSFFSAFFACLPIDEECLEEFVRQIQKCPNLDALVFGSPARICYAPKRVWLRALLKRLIDKMEAFGMEPSNVLYETLCASMAYDTENGGVGYFFRIFTDFSAPNFSQAPYILLKESVQHISQGTTGLSCWQASSVLANFFFHPSHCATFSAVSHVLELGAGCGLAGISFAVSNAVAKVTLTDAHPSVLCQLRGNVALNFDCAKSKTAAVSVEHLDWTDYERHSLPRDVDLIIASDVVFDRALFCPFAALLRHLLLGESAVGLICCAIRDKITVERFLGEIEKHGIFLRAQFDCRLRNCVSGSQIAFVRRNLHAETELHQTVWFDTIFPIDLSDNLSFPVVIFEFVKC